MEKEKTIKALEALEKAYKALKKAGREESAYQVGEIYDRINADLCAEEDE